MATFALVFRTSGCGLDAQRSFELVNLDKDVEVGSTYKFLKMNATQDDLNLVRDCISIQTEYDKKWNEMLGR